MSGSKEIYKWEVWNKNAFEIVDAQIAAPGLDRHFHDTWTFGQVVQGQCRFESGGVQHLALEGSLFIIPPLEVHTSSAGDAGVKYRIAYTHDHILKMHAPTLHAFMLSHHQRVWAEKGILAQRLCEAIENESKPDFEWIRDLHFSDASKIPPQRRGNPAKLQKSIHQAWNTPLDIAAIEFSIQQNRWQMIRDFKKSTGMTPQRYLKQLRILKSRYRLIHGDSLADTAHDLSFSDQSHYTRSFKQVFGISPGTFRKKLAVKNRPQPHTPTPPFEAADTGEKLR